MGIVSLLPPLFAVSAVLLFFRMLGARKHRTRSPRRPFPYRTLLLALSGTLGVGNITGVASAILIGGAGSVFWMLASALFAIVLKYRESTLSYRSGGVGMTCALELLPLGRFGTEQGAAGKLQIQPFIAHLTRDKEIFLF